MLDWKTDWIASDNYARNGVADVARLTDNYMNLAARIKTKYGLDVGLETVTLIGHATVPFADFLNTIEYNLGRLYWPPQLPKPPAKVTWQSGGAAPTFEDVNRWERNGELLDIEVVDTPTIPGGTPFAADLENLTNVVVYDGVHNKPAERLEVNKDFVADLEYLTNIVVQNGAHNQSKNRIEATYNPETGELE